MTTAYDMSSSIYESLRLFNWDIFLPVKDERELEKLFEDSQQQKSLHFLAGIVFDSLDLESSNSKTGKIRIRAGISRAVMTSKYKTL